ncbi:hypothetical protein B0H13DRAFT_1177258 [Mycena leptocephala]|nr:hypothetical protein B0H13DRAFT_1177258 [Mycena leptocephala]
MIVTYVFPIINRVESVSRQYMDEIKISRREEGASGEDGAYKRARSRVGVRAGAEVEGCIWIQLAKNQKIASQFIARRGRMQFRVDPARNMKTMVVVRVLGSARPHRPIDGRDRSHKNRRVLLIDTYRPRPTLQRICFPMWLGVGTARIRASVPNQSASAECDWIAGTVTVVGTRKFNESPCQYIRAKRCFGDSSLVHFLEKRREMRCAKSVFPRAF